jgi:RNA polymerase sigma factor (sigma-70 family)
VALRSSAVTDPVLIPLIEASEDVQQTALEQLLVEHARPVIAAVIARFARSEHALRRDDADDVTSTALLRLVHKLQGVEGIAIDDFEHYVATLTYHTIYDFMRRRYPERTRLKNRMRYLLEHDRRFALWKTRDVIACGLRQWSGREDLRETFSVLPAEATPVMLDERRPHDAIAALFERAGGPLPLEMLVRTLATLWQIRDAPSESPVDRVVQLPSHASRYESRQFIEILWSEIRDLQPRHRAALLLNLRDSEGVNAVALFVLLGIARLDEIAAAMGLDVDELESIWESLPLDDLAIAERLKMSRQQVINLRRSARERLSRRTLARRGT